MSQNETTAMDAQSRADTNENAASAAQMDRDAVFARMEADHLARQEENRNLRQEYLAMLRKAGAVEVVASYEGYGDSGNIEELVVLPHEGQEKLKNGVLGKLEDFVWDFAYNLHPGFENNEDGYGAFNWNIDEDLIDLEHGDRYVELSHTMHKGI